MTEHARYAFRGLSDGALSVTGVIIGAYGAGAEVIVSAGLTGALANGFSNMLAAFSAEQASLTKGLRELEESLLFSLENTIKGEEIRAAVRKGAFIDGISTIIGGVIPVISFIFLREGAALAASLTLTIIIFAALGVYTGKLTRGSIFLSGAKMSLFAAFTALICYLAQYLF